MSERTDTDLMGAARGGDRAALEALLERHAQRVYGFGLRMCRDSTDAEEIMQETLMAAATSAATWRGEGSVSSWLYAIARNACARRRRRRVGQPAVLEEFGAPGQTSTMAALDGDPEAALERARVRQALERGIDALPDTMREVLILRDVEGLRAQEVADVMGLSVAAVKSRLHRARARVRQSLAVDQPPAADCPDVVAALSRSVEGDLDRDACASLEIHVDQCDRCRGRCEGLKDVLALCASSSVPPVSNAAKSAALAAVSAPSTPE